MGSRLIFAKNNLIANIVKIVFLACYNVLDIKKVGFRQTKHPMHSPPPQGDRCNLTRYSLARMLYAILEHVCSTLLIAHVFLHFSVTSLLRKLKQQSRESLEARRPALIQALKELGDFYLELKWDFQSWGKNIEQA